MSPIRLFPAVLAFAAMLAPAVLQADTLEDLRKERREINRSIRKLVPDATKLDPELAELQRASINAQKVLNQAMEEHPSLGALNAEIKQAYDSLVQAIAAKDEAAKEAAQQRNSELGTRRNDEAAKIPELAKLMEANNTAGTAYFNREKEVIASHPETKELAARLAEINAAIQREMKK